MGRQVRRVLLGAVLMLGSSAFFLGILENSVLEQEETHSLYGHIQTDQGGSDRIRGIHKVPTQPWGKDFHDLVPHVHYRGDGPLNITALPVPQPPVVTGAPDYLRRPDYGRIWPIQNETQDRILNQMNLYPEGINSSRPKTILVYSGLPRSVAKGRRQFEKDSCPVQNCRITDNRSDYSSADAVMFINGLHGAPGPRPPGQIWILYVLESPLHIRNFNKMNGMVNWTATYRLDATINTPYERFVPYKNATGLEKPKRNYARGKSKMVAWFVSNCNAANGRHDYAAELGRHVEVDVYGACGTFVCKRTDSDKCYDLLNTHYKFYLAFENSNCIDYITEKFYWNALG